MFRKDIYVMSRLVAARTPHKRRQLRFQLQSGSSSDLAASQDEAGAAVLAEPEKHNKRLICAGALFFFIFRSDV